jgi:hypothetical protein
MSETTEQQPEQPSTTEVARPPELPAPREQREPAMARPRRVAARLGRFVQRPSVGGTLAAGIALGIAASVGVLEAAVAGGVAYGVYAILKKRQRER